MEDVATFRTRAEAWLRSVRPLKTDEPTVWGEGEFDVTVFHDHEPDEELELLAEYVDWHHEKMAAGFGAIAWPEEYGGAGLTKEHDRAFAMLEHEFDVPNDHELFSVTAHLVAPALIVHGTQQQKERFVERFLRADEFCCQLFSEPGAGSDLAGLSTKASRDGDRWLIDGQKVWTSNARIAPWGIPSPGMEVRPIRQMNGGASFNEVFFDGTPVTDDLRVGAEGDGWRVALTILGFERETSGSHGKRGGSFEDVVGLARAMGRTDDAVVRQQLAHAYCRERGLAWTRARSAAAAAMAGGRTGPEGSIGKLMWTENMRQMSDLVSLLLGPALTADTGEWGTYGWNDHVLGAPGYRIAGGSDQIQRNIIGERVLGLPSEPRVDRDIPFRDLQARRTG
jgi:alkylation response protein AidB-like acyl-CoA dehydrogenase